MPARKFYKQIELNAKKRLRELSPELTYHCYDHTMDVLEQSERIAEAEGVTDPMNIFLLKVAALYHDTGFLKAYRFHEAASCEIFLEETRDFNFSEADNEIVKRLIMATQIPQQPADILEKIICDADLDYLGRDDFFNIGETLRKEFQLFKVVANNDEWEILQLKFLKNHSYHTTSSQLLREPAKQLNISKLLLEKK
ncbi:MAG: HD domain-containing protein [Chitinophagaceae bacterium]